MYTLWKCSSFLSYLLLLTSLSGTSKGADIPTYWPFRRSCGVGHAPQALKHQHHWLQENEPLENDLWSASAVQQRHVRYAVDHSNHDHDRRQPSLLLPVYMIDTYIHIVDDPDSADEGSPNYVTDTMIQKQLRYLNAAFHNVSIGYRLMGIDRTTNTTWASNGDDLSMKRALRRGTYSSLNIYYQSLLQATKDTPGIPAGEIILGFCSLPTQDVTQSTSVGSYVIDGCNVLAATMPGGSQGGYNLGGTTAHEVGHWHGLFHTFDGSTCDSTHFGDYVSDTPQQAKSTEGCPAFQDSCPNSGVAAALYDGEPGDGPNPYGPQGYSGPDAIHNFMDYSSDACYDGFTPGQGARMLNIWQIYREGL